MENIDGLADAYPRVIIPHCTVNREVAYQRVRDGSSYLRYSSI
jgi:hypothetical protein